MNKLAKRVVERWLSTRSAKTYVGKANGKWCVLSTKNKTWNGGCFSSKEEAQARNADVAYFFHKNKGDL